jgi:hypothetical protein
MSKRKILSRFRAVGHGRNARWQVVQARLTELLLRMANPIGTSMNNQFVSKEYGDIDAPSGWLRC